MSTIQPLGKVVADATTGVTTTTTAVADTHNASTNASTIHPPTPAIGLNDLPLELLAVIADFIHRYSSLLAMMLVSHHLCDGVSLSRRWRIVNEVLADVKDTNRRSKILFDRRRLVVQASHVGRVRLLRYLQLKREEAYNLCLPVVCLHGNLQCVRYLMTEFDIKGEVRHMSLFGRASYDVWINGERSEINDVTLQKKSPFQLACGHGSLALVKFLHKECGVTCNRSVSSRSLLLACENGHLPVVQFLNTTFELTADDARARQNRCLRFAGTNGHLPVVQYLHTAFGLTADDACPTTVPYTQSESCLTGSCKNGHLPVVQYLHTVFGIPAGHTRRKCMSLACQNGHLPVVQYLHVACGLTVDDVLDLVDPSLNRACENSHLPVVQYLHAAFELTADQAIEKCLYAACRNGHLPVLQYLHTEVGLTGDDLHNRDSFSFKYACGEGHLPVVQYLHTAFGMTADDARDTNCLTKACERGDVPMVQYLITGFGLGLFDLMDACTRAEVLHGNFSVLNSAKIVHELL